MTLQFSFTYVYEYRKIGGEKEADNHLSKISCSFAYKSYSLKKISRVFYQAKLDQLMFIFQRNSGNLCKRAPKFKLYINQTNILLFLEF